ncbi:RNA polymerase sigma-70 factor (ECF subfamily) [Pontibacter mucosus]|uniref:RNA polymerase sigma-70 factor (ECF subfamily) n=1 Tax=Pontibacter mucosus TaxID=1649266 RepID=A0A2T5YHR6_9BACT|nr:RNA polymerase sigma-70 factor [Pontibacter mucosus]PTX18862.1 RNA polymerase sigma-70 factor (ECF subfamily) [Pontibacter mucosus]
MSANEDQAVPSDNSDLKQLFDRYYTRLVYFSAQVVGSQEAAEDIAQEAFIKYWNQRHDILPHPLAIKNYLYSTVKNASLNVARHQKVKADYAASLGEMAAVTESLDSAIIHAEVLAQLHSALSELPEGCQQISRMCYLDGKKNQEVAEELGISINTVKTQKKRALQLLRLKLNPELCAMLLFLEF